MIIPDVNLLLYAYDTSSPQHAVAARWWRELLSGETLVGLPHVTIFGFARIVTNPKAAAHPQSPAAAALCIRSWLAQPNVQIVLPGEGHTERVLALLQQTGVAGNLVTDAQLAALTIENHAILHTADADFLRFPGVRWLNPITGIGTDKLRRRR